MQSTISTRKLMKILWRGRGAYSLLRNRIWPKLNIIKADVYMYILVTNKFEQDQDQTNIKLENNKQTWFPPLLPYGTYQLPW